MTSAAGDIVGLGGRTVALHGVPDALAPALREAFAAEGAIPADPAEIVVIGTPATAPGATADVDPSGAAAVVQDAVVAAIARVQAALPVFRERSRGRIVLLVPSTSRLGAPGAAAESAAGGALLALARTWARELGPTGVTANAVSIGRAGSLDLLLGREPSAAEIAEVVVFLASDLAAFVNGAVVGADGGPLQ